MAAKWRTRDGCWSVEVVTLSLTPDHHDGRWIRVRRRGYFAADVRSRATWPGTWPWEKSWRTR